MQKGNSRQTDQHLELVNWLCSRLSNTHRQKIHLPQGLKLLNDVGVKFNGLHVLEEMGVRQRVGQLADRALAVHLLQQRQLSQVQIHAPVVA